MRLLISHRNFSLLWWAGLLSVIGSWALHIALPVYIYEVTGSTLATGLIVATGTVPRILLGSAAGVLVDRFDRQRILVITNLLLCVGLLPLLLVPAQGLLWVVYLVAFVQSVLSQFSDPAENALLPSLVEEDKLASANALNALNNNLGRLIGPALGGLLTSALGLQAVVIFDALTFLLASGLIGLIRVSSSHAIQEDDEAKPSPRVSAGLAGVWKEWLEGLNLIRQSRVVAVLFAFGAVTAVGEGVMSALFIPFVSDVLRGDSLSVGWLLSAQAIGGIVGGVTISVVASRFAAVQLFGWGALGVGLFDAAIFTYPLFLSGVTLGVVLFALVGLPVSALQAGFMTLFQTAVSDRLRGRLFGSYGTTVALFNLIGVGTGGLFGGRLGIIPVISIQAIVYLLGGVLVLAAFRKTDGDSTVRDSVPG
jgi:Na+/melibiose symporter-like transporter